MTAPPITAPQGPRAPQRATIAEWLAIPEERRAELIDGRIVDSALRGLLHGATQGGLFSVLNPVFGRRHRDDAHPGGWWLSQEVDMELGGAGCRPDVLGWRRDRHATLPVPDARGVVVAVPDWICEVLSPSTVNVDTGRKREAYHRAGVAWYWLADPERRSITVLRWMAEGYVITAVVVAGERARLAPFEAVELEVDEVFVDEAG